MVDAVETVDARAQAASIRRPRRSVRRLRYIGGREEVVRDAEVGGNAGRSRCRNDELGQLKVSEHGHTSVGFRVTQSFSVPISHFPFTISRSYVAGTFDVESASHLCGPDAASRG